MMIRDNSSAAGTALAVCVLVLSCSSTSSPASGDSGTPPPDSGPDGPKLTASSGLAGCAPTQAGCFTAGNAAYHAPSVQQTCSKPGAPATGAPDSHCKGVMPQAVSDSACGVTDAGPPSTSDAGEAGAPSDAGSPMTGICGENGPNYGATMYGKEADDDDCKYHVTYDVSPICQNEGTYFTVKPTILSRGGVPLTGACTYIELCLNDTHPAPIADARPPMGKQQVVEGPPGTYTVGPVEMDAPGDWTVRFHFNESCCDVLHESPHGHAAFHLSVP